MCFGSALEWKQNLLNFFVLWSHVKTIFAWEDSELPSVMQAVRTALALLLGVRWQLRALETAAQWCTEEPGNLQLWLQDKLVPRPDKLWMPHPLKGSKPGWMGLWAPWFSGRWPCPWHGGWEEMIINVSSVILWFYSGQFLLGGIAAVTFLRNAAALPNGVRSQWHWISVTTNQPWPKWLLILISSLTFHFYTYHQLADVDTTLLIFLCLAGEDTPYNN